MSDFPWGRVPAIGGIIAVVLTALAVIMSGSPPMIDDDTSEIASYFSDDRGLLLTATYLQVLATIPFFIFLAGFTRMLRRAEGEDSFLATTAFGAGVATGAMAVLCTAVFGTLAFNANKDYADESMTRALWNLQAIGFNFLGIFVGTFLLAAGVSIVRSGVLGRWLGWAGVVAAVVAVVGACAFADDGALAPSGALGLITLGLFLAFVLVSSIMMLMGQREARPATGMAPAG